MAPWSNKPDYGECSREISREILNLKVLLEAGCRHVPRLLGSSIRQQGHNGTLPGGYIAYIVMEKVPGKDLEGYFDMQESEHRCVQLAFLEAIWYAFSIPLSCL